nr:hypothetical protein [Akkermansiaceae bacterium]
MGPAILWAAATTAAVFLSLNLSSLPGLAQLGNLVAMGVVLGAAVMLLAFTPLAVRFPAPDRALSARTGRLSPSGGHRPALLLALVVPAVALVSLGVRGAPELDPEFRPFGITNAPAFQAWRQMQSRLDRENSLAPLIVTGDSGDALRDHVNQARNRLEQARDAGLLTGFSLPVGLIPNRDRQAANATTIRLLLPERDRLLSEIEAAGFSEEGMRLTRELFDRWAGFLASLESAREAIRPSGPLAEFVLAGLLSTPDGEGEHAFLATVQPADRSNRAWIEAICDEDASVASLGALGTALNARIKSDLVSVFLPMMAVLTLMLLLVFRTWRDLLLSVFLLVFV